ncbi:sigma-54-dependent Fis family transcriptional regulator [bacterium]|nr:sigma-54-dependent Fis family transcriptional regulator [bacterium]
MAKRILVVDDESGMRIALREVLARQGYEVSVASDALEAIQHIEEGIYDLVLTDVRMPEMTGIELLERLQVRKPELPILVMTAYGTIEDAVEAMKKGASDYLLKPFSSDTIEKVVKRALERSNPARTTEPEPAEESDESENNSGNASRDLIAISENSRQVLALSKQVADSVATILIQGESGTGKEVIARYIHSQSDRRNGPFVAVNCAALPEGLLESELFGHEKGAFTGAVQARKGKFELANRGTLLLDEVSEMPLPLQAKLLRVLQEREIDPIGAQKPVSLNVRVIATTNRNLANYVQEGNFREDLFYRLQVITVEMPPLRERRDDILPLAEYFMRRHCRVNRRPRKRMTKAMKDYLVTQNWRGNVRELENFLERAVLLCQTDEMTPENIFLGGNPSSPLPGVTLNRTQSLEPKIPPTRNDSPGIESQAVMAPGELVTLEEMERRLILQTLETVNGNRTRAADLLGVSVRTIRNKLHLYGLGGEQAKAAVS